MSGSSSGKLANYGGFPLSAEVNVGAPATTFEFYAVINSDPEIYSIFSSIRDQNNNLIIGFSLEDDSGGGTATTVIAYDLPDNYAPNLSGTLASGGITLSGTCTLDLVSLEIDYNVSIIGGGSVTGTGSISEDVTGAQYFSINPVFYPTTQGFYYNILLKTPASADPAPPQNLRAFLAASPDVLLDWNEDIEFGVTSLTLFRANGLGTPFSSAGSIYSSSPTGTTYLDTGTSLGGSYTYYLTATNGSGQSPPSNPATIVIPEFAPLVLVVPKSRLGLSRSSVLFVNRDDDELFLPATGVVDQPNYPPTESITLTTATCAPYGTLAIGGTTYNGPPSNVDIAVNGIFATSTSYSSATGTGHLAFTADDGTLSPGTYTIQARDTSNVSITSNDLTLVVEPELITLTAASISSGTLELNGTYENRQPTALDISVNGTWEPASSYTPSSGSFTASNGSLTPGTYTIQARDDVYPSVLSNTLTYVVTPTEIIDIINATVTTLGTELQLYGFSFYGPPENLNVSINDGDNFNASSNYTHSTPISSEHIVNWTCDGPLITSAGTYILQVQDSANTSILSNFYTLVVPPSGGGGGGGGGGQPTITLNAPTALPNTIPLDAINIIPLRNYAQQFTISLNGVTYTLRTYWNNQIPGWCMDISDVNGVAIDTGIPLVTGTDLLAQLQYLGIGGALYVATYGDPLAVPTYPDLGVTAFLYFVLNTDT